LSVEVLGSEPNTHNSLKCRLLYQGLVLIFICIFVESEDIPVYWHHTLSTVLSFVIMKENCFLELYTVVLRVIQMLVRGRIMAWEAEVGEWCVRSVENRLKPSLLFLVSEFSYISILIAACKNHISFLYIL